MGEIAMVLADTEEANLSREQRSCEMVGADGVEGVP
jgi:hypothetical protein